jgi:phage shock protein A
METNQLTLSKIKQSSTTEELLSIGFEELDPVTFEYFTDKLSELYEDYAEELNDRISELEEKFDGLSNELSNKEDEIEKLEEEIESLEKKVE